MASPIEKWEGASAYFTFADSPVMITAILLVTVAVLALCLIAGAIHESTAYNGVSKE